MSQDQQKNWMMVVEDQVDAWLLLKGALRRTLPHVLTVDASNGPTALSYLHGCLVERRPLPRMILMDLYMPALEDGLKLLHTLKEPASAYSHLPVVVMSSSTDPHDRQHVTQRGSSYLTKPLSYSDWDSFLASIDHHWNESLTIPPV
ncbi:response regulator [Spirosoma sp.]|uniref:response regulator n=1 Tax=Spirosoma sp. TaxID=1899569 RepID=UPI0026080940|nr:response regulator [Spirosoma sp.]MCX6219109.1 response regulator [Spirosoma sp.]